MQWKKTQLRRFARIVRACIARIDPRLLVALVSFGGVLAWVLPWQWGAVFFILACIVTLAAITTLPAVRAAFAAYGLFLLLWMVSQFCLYLFEYPGQVGPALAEASDLGRRLFTLLGLALAMPLATTPLVIARTLNWYLTWLTKPEEVICAKVLRGKVQPMFAGSVWRAALALCLMMAFFPSSMRAVGALKKTLFLRAPHLPLHKKVVFMGLALLRVVSSRTWDMTLAITSRNMDRPGPWGWRKPLRPEV